MLPVWLQAGFWGLFSGSALVVGAVPISLKFRSG